MKNDVALQECTNTKCTKVHDAFIMKNHVIKRIVNLDVSIGPFVKIKPLIHILYGNRLLELKKCKSKVFYQMLVKKERRPGNMESVYSHEFNFENKSLIWQNVYITKKYVK